MTLLLMTLLIMTTLTTQNIGEHTYNDISHNLVYF